MSAVNKSIQTTTVDCLWRVVRMRLTALQTGRGSTLSMQVIGVASRGQPATADTTLFSSVLSDSNDRVLRIPTPVIY